MVRNKIQILDCTLRDGGYCNQWEFGKNNITKIINGLVKARVEIIECGFLTNRIEYNEDVTKFRTLEDIKRITPAKKTEDYYVCMMNFGEYDLNELPKCDGTSVDGIRVAFHKKDMISALEVCEHIQKKAYDVYVQAMVSMSYSDEEFLQLIDRVNSIKPKAFYIVDSFGAMKAKDLLHLLQLVEENLESQIDIGFHCHNNMQLAYSNAQKFISFETKHNLIVDLSIMGMGRGAGNLNTELFVEYLNEYYGKQYLLQPLFNVIDEVLNSFYYKNYWGYSLPNYLSAKYNIHPNYASYLTNKNTLTVSNLDEIFSTIDSTKKVEFDKNYVEKLYLQYMDRETVYEQHFSELKKIISGRTVLVIGPGRSVEIEKEKILKYCAKKSDVIKISINFQYSHLETDYIFVSNLRRFKEIDKELINKMIITSNIPVEKCFAQVQYHDLKNDIESVKDNAGMMLLKLLYILEAKKIILAGIDGYSHDESLNYAKEVLELVTQRKILDEMNQGMEILLKDYSEKIPIEFLTSSRFARKNEEQDGFTTY